ncbi:hypothetical protein BJ085DRAFT_24282 [Dimargaris cristalligena]|uniref:Peroxisomal hydratase-dehydrogenase-epimerase n=1 Tax=Dimargaris cristalligena TaxID=215637 RepID=A0A4P9ZYG1_9FUNG|nr:hypothetical protein BJ085DRAFT_24282 [Dimargaris cristalligena]|eukprot:RKP37972.1 hypothetical protein BJ085DRAFT_24282 [Dimargaris cristalligena]
MPAQELRYDGKVVVVTGAGGGLGRDYALFFASRGASVVVNDLGSSLVGGGASHSAADSLVEEIRQKGGKAVANYDSVENGAAIVQTALEAFGRIDVLINNAGVLRDKSFAQMTDADWNLVQAVHLRGAFLVTKAAWDTFRRQKFGRIIMTTSSTGLYGNYGQANYGSAKLALVGLSNTLAQEGAKYNIHCNAIAPIAMSRMTESTFPAEVAPLLSPKCITPLVAYLCHDSCAETGGAYELGGGCVTKVRWERGQGHVFKADASFTPAAVQAEWGAITDFSHPYYPKTITEVNWMELLERANAASAGPAHQGAPLRFDGKVVVVTGAGAGLGRAYALLFARLGAKLVLNDLGRTETGRRTADVVVEEVQQLGAPAVANYSSVDEGDAVIEAAIRAFGRVDVIVNNAGILRDRSFARMTAKEWDLVYQVHLLGTYKVTRAAWPYFLKQKSGRVINTCSAVGLYGNFGQANYSACKAGILGLSNVLALEGAKHNIKIHTIAPNAGTSMTATIMPPEVVEALKPDYVAPLVAYLSHDACTTTGDIFEVGSGWVAQVRRQRSAGKYFDPRQPLTPEAIRDHWSEISSFEGRPSAYPRSGPEAITAIVQEIVQRLQTSQKAGGKAPAASQKLLDVAAVRQRAYPELTFSYTERDVILYALGIGASRKDLHLVYENDLNFSTFPTFPVLGSHQGDLELGAFLPNFRPMMLLHGEQFLEIHRPVPTEAALTMKTSIVDVLDKKSGAVVVARVTYFNADKELVATTESSLFVRGSGGFSQHPNFKAVAPSTDRSPAALASNDPPARPADAVVSQHVPENQAALYRLNGDYNPLHLDPAMSSLGGFKIPILHGLCSYGHAARHIMQTYGGNQADFLKDIKARFTGHVFPGETLETHMWLVDNGCKVLFQVRDVERDSWVIKSGAVTLTKPATTAVGQSKL